MLVVSPEILALCLSFSGKCLPYSMYGKTMICCRMLSSEHKSPPINQNSCDHVQESPEIELVDY